MLLETRDQLDISILSAEKWIKSKNDIETLLNTHLSIEHKTDGTKLTVVHVANNGTIDDWIIAYKNSIFYANEFKYQDMKDIKAKSIGVSQYKIVLEHFANLGKCNIPVGYEYSIEFLQRKPTLSSNYTDPHHLVLIGYCPCSYKVEFGTLRTNSKVMLTEFRDSYAKEMSIDSPNKLFNGVLGTKESFEAGIINDNLRKEFKKSDISWSDPEEIWSGICKLLLSIESKYGGKEEGVVIKFGNTILKVQQEYQLDKDARARIKAKTQMSVEDENKYWSDVHKLAKKFTQECNTGNFEMRLEKLSKLVANENLKIFHSKKNEIQIKDDIQLSAKLLIRKALEGNNGCLVIGKFRILTTAHVAVINEALKNFDRVLVCLVTSKETKATLPLRRKMLEMTFGNNISIIETSSGFIGRIIQMSPFDINAVYCGSDRLEDYVSQCKKLLGVNVLEYERNANAISASKVIANLDDKKYFRENTPKQIHKLYDTLVDTYEV